jgi:nucleoside-diphosphate-sugar epimerase
MARVLIVGCGCRGQALAAALGEHVVRGTTRSAERLPELQAAGVEGVVADPDRLATLVPSLSGVTVVCWLMGSADGSPEVNGDRLQTLMEHLVDTPVRGLVYEAAGSLDPDFLERGADVVRSASRTWHMPVEVVMVDPGSREEWVGAMKAAVERVLSG